MNELILATSNTGKINEIQQILTNTRCIPQSQLHISDADETGLSFVENAIIKARHASFYAEKPALADDSGLVVPALNGEPGIYSARYAGMNANSDANMARLLQHMAELPAEQRGAYFYCAIALVTHGKDPTPIIATGIFHGSITTSASGNHGFGYDPIFFVDQHQCTAAQLPAAIKNTISHRAQALAQLRTLVPSIL